MIAPRRLLKQWQYKLTSAIKHVVYWRGEPYDIPGHRLLYVPGTRPIRMSYADVENDGVARFDARQTLLLIDQVKPGDFVLEIGAHVGQHTLILCALCGPSGKVIAFEPDADAHETFHRNVRLNPQIAPPTLEPFAVSDRSGSTMLYTSGEDANSTLGKATAAKSGKMVQQVSIDEYLQTRNLPPPQWLKLDIEGAEIRALQGARRYLEGDGHVLCELHPYAWADFGNTLDDLKSIAKQSRRTIRYLDSDEPIGDKVQYGIVVLERIK